MSFALPKPKVVTDDEVVLSREDWDSIVRVLGEPSAEDEDDIAAVAAARMEDARFAAQIVTGRNDAVAGNVARDPMARIYVRRSALRRVCAKPRSLRQR